MYQASSGGVINLKIEFEQSYGRPITEGTADPNWITTDTIHSGLTHRNWQLATIDGVEMPFGRFKVTGQGSNAATTRLQIKVSQE